MPVIAVPKDCPRGGISAMVDAAIVVLYVTIANSIEMFGFVDPRVCCILIVPSE